jgi:hypothetical protein
MKQKDLERLALIEQCKRDIEKKAIENTARVIRVGEGHNFTREEYIEASENHIRDWAKSIGFDLSNGGMWVAIHAELRTMFDVGYIKGQKGAPCSNAKA